MDLPQRSSSRILGLVFCRLGAWLCLLLGIIIILGRFAGISLQIGTITELDTCPLNKALALTLVGFAFFMLAPVMAGPWRRRMGYTSLAIVFLLSGLTFLETLVPTGVNLDQWVWLGPAAERQWGPISMGYLAALVFLMLGGALALSNSRRLPWLAEFLAACAVFTCLLSLSFEAFRALAPRVSPTTPRVLFSSGAMLLLGLGIFASRPQRGIMKFLGAPLLGSLLARRLLPIAILSPVLLFWLVLAGLHYELISSTIAGLLYFVANITIFCGVILWCADSLNRLDRQRAQTRAELQRSEKQFRALIENSHDVIFMVRPDGVISYASPATERLLGVRPEECCGQPYGRLLNWAPTHGAKKDASWHAAAGTSHFVHRLNHRESGWRWVEETRVNLLEDPAIGAVICSLRDVTDRKTRDEVLQSSEERYRDLVENANDVIYSHDLSGRFTSINHAGTALLGYSNEEIRTLTIADLAAPDQLETARRMLAQKLAGTGRTAYELDVVAKDGRRLTVEVSSRLAQLPGQPVQVQGVARDVTARKQVDAALKEADKKKDEFLALLAHELRNPLAPLRNGLQIMRLSSSDPETLARARGMMDRQLSHMVRLIDDLLDISRISRNKLELQKAPVLLADVLHSAIETARPVIDAAHHHLEIDLPAQPVLLDADLTRLSQVFSNLLTNSAKYTEPGGRIALSAEVSETHALVRVRDNGIGIPPEALSRIFDMFSQLDRGIERTTGGLGIGLAIVKGLVEMHGGTVSAESPGSGQGTTFTISLPVLRPMVDEVEGNSLEEQAAHTRMTAQRVLVVDDNQDAAESMATMLTILGNVVHTAHDGLEAIACAERFRPEIILMDLGMPRLSGLEATRRIRQESWGKDIRIVALTGWGQSADRQNSREAGCNGHLVKPVSLADLEATLVNTASENGEHNPATSSPNEHEPSA